jgi:hypothetical protein
MLTYGQELQTKLQKSLHTSCVAPWIFVVLHLEIVLNSKFNRQNSACLAAFICNFYLSLINKCMQTSKFVSYVWSTMCTPDVLEDTSFILNILSGIITTDVHCSYTHLFLFSILPILNTIFTVFAQGRAIAQAVSRRLPTAAVRVRA